MPLDGLAFKVSRMYDKVACSQKVARHTRPNTTTLAFKTFAQLGQHRRVDIQQCMPSRVSSGQDKACLTQPYA